jgi:ABC-type Fe3+-hydroxamate transport system substrate-binding protein
MNIKDQLGREVVIGGFPQRIISIVPSQTELLYHLGLENEVVGITKFCVHPEEWFRNKTRVGGTKKLNLDTIAKLQPDLIIANREENDKEQIEELSKLYPVWISDIITLDDSLDMIRQVGGITNKVQESIRLTEKIQIEFKQINHEVSGLEQLRTLYLIWYKPYMAAGKGTFINQMLKACNLNNATDIDRYPELTIEQIKEITPEVILLSSEPYPFKQKHIDELKQELPNTLIKLVDGEMFSWYGSRLTLAPAYFRSLLKEIHSK